MFSTFNFRSASYGIFILILSVFGLVACRDDHRETPEMREATKVALEWNKLLLDLERHSPGYRPPVSARMLAYVEMAAYEAALPALPGYVSMQEYVKGYRQQEIMPDAKEFCLPASLNAAYGQILLHFFPNAPEALQNRIKELGRREDDHFGTCREEIVRRSTAFGLSAAESVWRWSMTDSLGHDGFLYNYDRSYEPPACKGCWKSSETHRMPPLTPHWGGVRPFVVAPGQIEVKAPQQFNESPGSAFYAEAMEVFSISQPLSKENRWIAEFWSDDFEGLTVSPAGRWISILNQVVEQAEPDFPVVLEAYLKTGLALCDAGILCWSAKYKYNLERPQDYIRRVIQTNWEPLHSAPPFPSYPSGHSMFGAAACNIMSQLFGDSFTITDDTHKGRKEFAGMPRTFHSFAEMARENALSRVAIGVHYRMDCEEGLRLGRLIGQRVAALPLRKSEAAR
ncbi:MAG: vanadium-dependent haloperoxidase [Bacteroidota bacterium]